MSEKTKRYSFLDLSRMPWGADLKVDASGNLEYPGMERLLIGCAMRIADATETMGKRVNEMQFDIERLKQDNRDLRERLNKSRNTLNNYRQRLARSLVNNTEQV